MSGNGWPTIRRFARTLDEAFTDSRAGWSEGWARPHHNRWASRLLAVCIGVALAVVLVRWIDWSIA